MTKRDEEYWYVQGQAYDLTAFSEVHPGGKDQLFSVQGRDITEMVYSMHAVASIEKVKQIMEKYKVLGKKNEEPELFVWNGTGFYENLRQKVINYIRTNDAQDGHKANNRFWIITALEIVFQAILVYWWVYNGSLASAFLAGVISTSLGFMVFHTAGHCGISTNPKVNNFWFNLYANYVLGFISTLWDIHHNYGHHSYTNIYRKDPDVSNQIAFVRKSEAQKLKPQHRLQWYTAYLVLCLVPNQWWGQVVQYAMSLKRGRIFGVPMLHKREVDNGPFVRYFGLVAAFGVMLAMKQGIWSALIGLYIYSTGVGLVYWACVFPNHDTDSSEQSTMEDLKSNDWGIHQILHSSNFRIPDWMAYFIGGMNYQIEHHLFPCVHPRHYPAISKIVQQECKKSGVEYHMHSSWFDALRGNFNHLWKMSKSKSH